MEREGKYGGKKKKENKKKEKEERSEKLHLFSRIYGDRAIVGARGKVHPRDKSFA